jgi:hypothetical protein
MKHKSHPELSKIQSRLKEIDAYKRGVRIRYHNQNRLRGFGASNAVHDFFVTSRIDYLLDNNFILSMQPRQLFIPIGIPK